MFKETKVRLTIFYSILFLSIFWLFSLGLYFWISRSFGTSYINEVRKEQHEQFEGDFENENYEIMLTIAGKVAITRLRNIILILNGSFLVVVPLISWVVTRKTLAPVQKIHEQQKQFVSDVSHELRTPLSILSGAIEVALRNRRSSDEYIEVLKSSRQELSYLINLVENLLFLAKEDQKENLLGTEKIDLTDLLNNVIISLKEKINEKKLKLKLNPAEESITVTGQASMLRQLFFNIMDNAINYTNEKGSINISIKANLLYVIITVTDSGIGIATEDQKKIFERFYRVDASRSQTKGYGLGLSISASIVKAHNGRIELASRPGKGTTVSIFIPRT